MIHKEKYIKINDEVSKIESISKDMTSNDNSPFILSLLGKYYEKRGTKINVLKKKEESNQKIEVFSIQSLFSLIDQKKYELHFDFGEKQNMEYLNDTEKFNKLKEKMKLKLSKDFKVPKDKIIITYPQKGSLSVQIIFQSDEFNNLDLEQFKQKFKNDKDFSELQNLKSIHMDTILGACKLSKNQL